MFKKNKNLTKSINISSDDQGLLSMVTAGDSSVFTQIFELLESIENTESYDHIIKHVIDLGLSEQEKSVLIKSFNNVIFWSIDNVIGRICDGNQCLFSVMQEADVAERALFALSGFHLMVPEKYLLVMEADTWVQTETSITILFEKAQEIGIGCTEHGTIHGEISGFCGHSPGYHLNILKLAYPDDFLYLIKQKMIGAGVYCLYTQSYFANKFYINLVKFIEATGSYDRWSHELYFSKSFYETIGSVGHLLSRYHHFSATGWYCDPILDSDNNLMDPYYQKKIGIFHYATAAKKNAYHYHLTKKLSDDQEIRVIASIRYRSLPIVL